MFKNIAKRFGRVAVSTLLAGAAQYASGSKYALILAPVLSAVGKWAREKGMSNVPV